MAKLISTAIISLEGIADKAVVYSRTLKAAPTPRTRIEQHFIPEAVEQLKAPTVRNFAVGVSALAAHTFNAGTMIIDVC